MIRRGNIHDVCFTESVKVCHYIILIGPILFLYNLTTFTKCIKTNLESNCDNVIKFIHFGIYNERVETMGNSLKVSENSKTMR